MSLRRGRVSGLLLQGTAAMVPSPLEGIALFPAEQRLA